MQEVFVVLPAYNEGEALVTLLCELEAVLQPYGFHLLLVDDGSTDGSRQRVEALALPHVQILAHPQNRGLGEAMRTGLSAAVQQAHRADDIIIVMDSDCTHTPYLIERLIRLIQEGNDVVIASRFRYGARVVGLSWHRVFLSHAASWVFRLCVPIANVKDYTCGYRAYRAGLLTKAFATYREDFIRETGFSCMVDILIKLARMNAKITEVPLVLRYDCKQSASKMKIFRTIRSTLKLLIRTIWHSRSILTMLPGKHK